MKKRVEIYQVVDVTVDETKFTEEFFANFNAAITDYGSDVDKHVEHLAMLHARGAVDDSSFIEGYGPAKGMGIRFEVKEADAEVLTTLPAEAAR